MRYLQKTLFPTMIFVSAIFTTVAFTSTPAMAQGNSDTVELCNTIVGNPALDCPGGYFGACNDCLNAARRKDAKSARFLDRCPTFDIVTFGSCTTQHAPAIPKICKCIVETDGCPRGAIGACITNLRTSNQQLRACARFGELGAQCTPAGP